MCSKGKTFRSTNLCLSPTSVCSSDSDNDREVDEILRQSQSVSRERDIFKESKKRRENLHAVIAKPKDEDVEKTSIGNRTTGSRKRSTDDGEVGDIFKENKKRRENLHAVIANVKPKDDNVKKTSIGDRTTASRKRSADDGEEGDSFTENGKRRETRLQAFVTEPANAPTDWSREQVKKWVSSLFGDDVGNRFYEEEIDGRALMESKRLEEDKVLERLGISTIGKKERFERELRAIRPQMKEKGQTRKEQPSKTWKRKIGKSDKTSWNEQNKSLYHSKTSVIRREAKKIWPGNNKIYFKQNPTNTLKLEELTDKLAETCSVEDIGFGREAIRSHILQWAQEKNRRISDGYDFEAEHVRAKRAKSGTCTGSSSTSPSSSYSSEGGDTEAVIDDSLEENEMPVEKDVNNMSDKRSAKIVLLVAFNANSYDNLSVKKSLLPLAKHLSVKTRGLGKYDMAIPVAKELIKQGYITPKENGQELNYNGIKRNDIVSAKDIAFLFKGSPKEDSVSGNAGTGSKHKKDITSSYSHGNDSAAEDGGSDSENM